MLAAGIPVTVAIGDVDVASREARFDRGVLLARARVRRRRQADLARAGRLGADLRARSRRRGRGALRDDQRDERRGGRDRRGRGGRSRRVGRRRRRRAPRPPRRLGAAGGSRPGRVGRRARRPPRRGAAGGVRGARVALVRRGRALESTAAGSSASLRIRTSRRARSSSRSGRRAIAPKGVEITVDPTARPDAAGAQRRGRRARRHAQLSSDRRVRRRASSFCGRAARPRCTCRGRSRSRRRVDLVSRSSRSQARDARVGRDARRPRPRRGSGDRDARSAGAGRRRCSRSSSGGAASCSASSREDASSSRAATRSGSRAAGPAASGFGAGPTPSGSSPSRRRHRRQAETSPTASARQAESLNGLPRLRSASSLSVVVVLYSRPSVEPGGVTRCQPRGGFPSPREPVRDREGAAPPGRRDLRARPQPDPRPLRSARRPSRSRSPCDGRRVDRGLPGLSRDAQHRARPVEGRHPLPPRRHARRGQVARDVDDVEVRAHGASLRRRQGRRRLRPEERSRRGSSSG